MDTTNAELTVGSLTVIHDLSEYKVLVWDYGSMAN